MSTGELIAAPEPPSNADLLVSRQPVLDRELRVRGYRIQYAAPETQRREAAYAPRLFGDVMSVVGLEELVGESVAHLPLSDEMLLRLGVPPVRPDRLILRVAHATAIRPEIAAVLDSLAARGYSLSLYELPAAQWDLALMHVFGIVEVDCSAWSLAQAAATVPPILAGRATPLATHLGAQEDFEQARAAGFQLFAGPFFTSPPATPVRRVPVGELGAFLSISKLVGREDALDELEQLIERDTGLSVKLLRYINSAYFGMAGPVASIRQAVALLGARGVSRWALLISLTGAPNAPRELSVIALTRARMCALVAAGQPGVTEDELFMVGLLSIADALLQTSLETIVDRLPLAKEVSEALVHRTGPAGAILESVLAYERGDLGARVLEQHGPSLARVYRSALSWAEEALATIS